MSMRALRASRVFSLIVMSLALTAIAGCKQAQVSEKSVPPTAPRPAAEAPAPNASAIVVTSSAFKDGETIPTKYTDDGENVSPPLSWSKPPEGTVQVAVACDDPDAPGGLWTHWLLWGLPPSTTDLAENTPKSETVLGSAKQGTADSGKVGYWGPGPPPGKPHHYIFTVYALKAKLDLKPGAKGDEFRRVIAASDVLAKGKLTGLYGR